MNTTTSFSLAQATDHEQPFRLIPAQDITGWTLLFTAQGLATQAILTKDNRDPSDLKYHGGITITNALLGQLKVSLVRADTLALVPDTFAWTLLRIDTNNNEALASGSFYLLPGIDL